MTTITPNVDPGFLFSDAYDLGVLGETITIQDDLVPTQNGEVVDAIDYYQFTVNEVGEYTFTLDGLSADANLVIINAQDINANGEATVAVDSSTAIGTQAENIVTQLAPGTYFVGVFTGDGAPTAYNLTVGNGSVAPTPTPTPDATPVPPDTTPGVTPTPGSEVITPTVDPGFDINTTYDLGAVAGTVTVAESVGAVGTEVDPGDIYQFTVSQAGEYSVALEGLTANADLAVFTDVDGDGAVDLVGISETAGTESEVLVGELAPGEYYAVVASTDGVGTNYNLTISDSTVTTPPTNTPAPPTNTPPTNTPPTETPPTNTPPTETPPTSTPPAQDPGDSFDTALDIGALENNTSVFSTEAIGGNDIIDVYQFSIAETTEFGAVLTNLNADVDLAIFDGNGEFLGSSETEGIVDEAVTGTIEAGTYFVAVVSYDGVATSYDLGLATGTALGIANSAADFDSLDANVEDYSLI